jgi:hypothetical protein
MRKILSIKPMQIVLQLALAILECCTDNGLKASLMMKMMDGTSVLDSFVGV